MKFSKYLLILIFIILFFLGIGFFKNEIEKKPYLKELVNNKDSKGLYSFYISAVPSIENRPFFGDRNASITLISYIDPTSESSKLFFSDFFNWVNEKYIKTGIIRFIPKFSISKEDFEENNEKFKKSQSLACTKEEFFEKYFKIMAGETIKENLCENYSIIIQDLSEVEHFGFKGTNPRIYLGIEGKSNKIFDGIPSQNQFARSIRELQTYLGD